MDDWLRRQLIAERAWTRRSVLGSLGGLTLAACARGPNATTAASDGIFSDGVSYQLPSVTANAATGGYDAALTVGIA
jgi:hypothetical protein